MVTEIIAHRGGALLWPENSHIAVENAAKLGVEQVQVDVHPTRDGRIVVIHDATLDRTTSGTGPVGERSWAELSSLVLNGTDGARIPLLEEVVEQLRPTAATLRLEVKPDADKRLYPGFSARIAALLRDAGFLGRTIITGFQLAALEEFAGQAAALRQVWLISGDVLAAQGLAGVLATARARDVRAHDVRALGLRWSSLDGDTLAAIRGAGLGIGCFGCNDAAAIARMLPCGLDELMTDRPDLALQSRAGGRPPA